MQVPARPGEATDTSRAAALRDLQQPPARRPVGFEMPSGSTAGARERGTAGRTRSGPPARRRRACDCRAPRGRRALVDGDDEDVLFSVVEARRPEEVTQYRRDRLSWQQRLDGLATERDRELEAVAAR